MSKSLVQRWKRYVLNNKNEEVKLKYNDKIHYWMSGGKKEEMNE